MLKKIVIIGPESTGKSTLCEQLSRHYNTTWVPEYARKYLLEHGTGYNYDNLLTIAKEQVITEDDTAQKTAAGLLFIDTDMNVMKIWCEFVFNNCHLWILHEIARRKYDLYLLCNTDLPWVKDELREYPDIVSREKLYHMYRDIMISQPVPWVDIRGTDEERLRRAVNGIDKYILHNA
jgi:NadR type nicotinamide-nucleotide adenylyltransferase